MGGKSGGSDREARLAREAEEARQKRIAEGTSNINAMFDYGGKGDLLSADAVFDPKAAYYLEDGTLWRPAVAETKDKRQQITDGLTSGFQNGGVSAPGAVNGSPKGAKIREAMGLPAASTKGGGASTPTQPQPGSTKGGGSAVASPEDQFKEMMASGKLYGGNGGFNSSYYDGIAQSYLDYANPQLADQHGEANRQMQYDLARTGKLDSSTRATKGADLQQAYDLGQQQIADKALGQKNQAKGAVEDARASLISQLNATGDATGATNAAINRIGALSQPAGGYDVLSGLFSDFTGALGGRYAQERAYAASGGASVNGYQPVTAGARPGAVKVTG